MALDEEVNELLGQQLSEWPQAADNYAALAGVRVKEFDVDGMHFKVQFNLRKQALSTARYRMER